MSAVTMQLELYQDRLDDRQEVVLPTCQRIVYCVDGQSELSGKSGKTSIGPDEAAFCADEVTVRAGPEGAYLWRWELTDPRSPSVAAVPAAGRTVRAGSYPVALDPASRLLMRLDRVNFPPGGEALPHIHAAPGLRCILTGSIRVETAGASHRIWPGDCWWERGPDQVHAWASSTQPTSFIRAMIIPESYRGRSTITYVRASDQDVPKAQSYKRYVEEPLTI